jgi:hypothetical protein
MGGKLSRKEAFTVAGPGDDNGRGMLDQLGHQARAAQVIGGKGSGGLGVRTVHTA